MYSTIVVTFALFGVCLFSQIATSMSKVLPQEGRDDGWVSKISEILPINNFIIKSIKAFEIFVVEIKKENKLFSNIENVGSVASIILFQFCDVAKVGNHPSADSAKFGY
jgi:hypothetical protein